MGSLKRKIARKKAKREKKKAEKQMKQQLFMFDKLGDSCDACGVAFDKKSKEHAMTWKVVVKSETEQVRLFCPDCWQKAEKLTENLNDSGV